MRRAGRDVPVERRAGRTGRETRGRLTPNAEARFGSRPRRARETVALVNEHGPRTDGMAIGALICGILALIASLANAGVGLLGTACCPLCAFGAWAIGLVIMVPGLAGVITGGFSIKRINDRPDTLTGKGLAIGGIVTGALACLLVVIIIVVPIVGVALMPTPTTPTPTYDPGVYDPGTAYDPSADPSYDPSAVPADPSAMPVDPSAVPADPSALPPADPSGAPANPF